MNYSLTSHVLLEQLKSESVSKPGIHERLPLHCAFFQDLDWDLGLKNVLSMKNK